jgi:hypothetical protein
MRPPGPALILGTAINSRYIAGLDTRIIMDLWTCGETMLEVGWVDDYLHMYILTCGVL